MNAYRLLDQGGAPNRVLAEADFKWLMAGLGYWIDPERLRQDRSYAKACAESALKTGSAPLQRCVDKLKQWGMV